MRYIDVHTGEVAVGAAGSVLTSSGIGSCVAVVALDTKVPVAGIAHVMLPGEPPAGAEPPALRYAQQGVRELLRQLEKAGAAMFRLRLCMAGGANVLMRAGDTIGDEVAGSVERALASHGLTAAATSLGGFLRRRVRVDVSLGRVCCSLGDGPEEILWPGLSSVG